MVWSWRDASHAGIAQGAAPSPLPHPHSRQLPAPKVLRGCYRLAGCHMADTIIYKHCHISEPTVDNMRYHTVILQPLLAKVTHRARPMPDPAPVTSTVLLVQSIFSVVRLIGYISTYA